MSYDSWFASSKEFERLKKKKLLNCHNCNSSKVEKTIMSPRLIKKSNEKLDLKFKKINNDFHKNLSALNGQALHAKSLGFIHPSKNEWINFESELPSDFKKLLDLLKNLCS